MTPLEVIIAYWQWYVLIQLGHIFHFWERDDDIMACVISILLSAIWPITLVSHLLARLRKP